MNQILLPVDSAHVITEAEAGELIEAVGSSPATRTRNVQNVRGVILEFGGFATEYGFRAMYRATASRIWVSIGPLNGVSTPAPQIAMPIAKASADANFPEHLFSKDFMRDSFLSYMPLPSLFRDLSRSVKTFVHEELELARTEMMEKVSCYGRNAASLAIGGAVAYAGLIVFLGGLGILVGWAIQKTNLNPALANFIGLGAVGLVVILVGAVMVLKGVKAFSTGSIAPQRTIATIKHLNGKDADGRPKPKADTRHVPKRSPDELKAIVLATEEHIGATIDEIAYRASPARLKVRASTEIRARPYTWSLAALGGGLVTSLLLKRRLRL